MRETGTCVILGAGERSNYRIRRPNGMDIMEKGTSTGLLLVEGVPGQREDTCRLIEEECNSEYGELWVVRPDLVIRSEGKVHSQC